MENYTSFDKLVMGISDEERVLYTNCGYIPDIVYDLIQAGLVEKVNEE